ncbi:MAG: carboxyvinyl-carboxyphosphonate phosphorylmutase, partial [Burkholderiaceae bacterium]
LPMRAQMLDFDQLNALIGTPELLALGQRYE